MHRFVAIIALSLIVVSGTADSQVCDMIEFDSIAVVA